MVDDSPDFTPYAEQRNPGTPVLRFADVDAGAIRRLLAAYGLSLVGLPANRPIPGSFWGDEEAGLLGHSLYARPDTPVHSILHEAGHFVCMDPDRRADLDTNAGGDYAEENGVCYLQILLADHLPAMGRARMFADMDAWGYCFRLGSARRWFEADAEDARDWLQRRGIIDAHERITWRRWEDAPGNAPDKARERRTRLRQSPRPAEG